MQRANQQPDAVFARLAVGILIEKCDGAANPIVSENQLEAFAGMHALMKGDLDDRFLIFLRLKLLDSGRNRRGFADRPKIWPRARDIAIGEKQAAHLARRIHESALVDPALVFRQVLQALRLYQGQAESMPALHETRFE